MTLIDSKQTNNGRVDGRFYGVIPLLSAYHL